MVKKYHFQIEPSLLKAIQFATDEEARLKAVTGDLDLQRVKELEEFVKRNTPGLASFTGGVEKEIEETLSRLSMAGLAQDIHNRANLLPSGILNQIELDRIQQSLPDGLYRQLNPTASEIYEQMNQKAIDDAKLRAERPLTEIDFAPPFDFQRAERDRRDRQRECDREHDIETARLAEIARLQVRDEHEASKQAAVVAGAAVTDAPVVVAPNPSTSTPAKPKRRDEIWPVIEQAQRQLSDPFDAAAIWLKLCEWAQAKVKTFPLIGITGDAIQWRTDPNDDPKELTQKGLRDRLGKQKRREQPKVKTPLKRVK